MAQYLLPNDDVGTTAWVQGAGDDDANWFNELEEGFGAGRGSGSGPDQTTYWSSGNNPTNSDIEVGLASGANPGVDTGHIVRSYFEKNAAGGRQIDLTITLLQTTTTIESWTITNIGSAWTTDAHAISEANAANITDYSALRVRVRANNPDTGPARAAWLSAVEVELPDAPSVPWVPPQPHEPTVSIFAAAIITASGSVQPPSVPALTVDYTPLAQLEEPRETLELQYQAKVEPPTQPAAALPPIDWFQPLEEPQAVRPTIEAEQAGLTLVEPLAPTVVTVEWIPPLAEPQSVVLDLAVYDGSVLPPRAPPPGLPDFDWWEDLESGRAREPVVPHEPLTLVEPFVPQVFSPIEWLLPLEEPQARRPWTQPEDPESIVVSAFDYTPLGQLEEPRSVEELQYQAVVQPLTVPTQAVVDIGWWTDLARPEPPPTAEPEPWAYPEAPAAAAVVFDWWSGFSEPGPPEPFQETGETLVEPLAPVALPVFDWYQPLAEGLPEPPESSQLAGGVLVEDIAPAAVPDFGWWQPLEEPVPQPLQPVIEGAFLEPLGFLKDYTPFGQAEEPRQVLPFYYQATAVPLLDVAPPAQLPVLDWWQDLAGPSDDLDDTALMPTGAAAAEFGFDFVEWQEESPPAALEATIEPPAAHVEPPIPLALPAIDWMPEAEEPPPPPAPIEAEKVEPLQPPVPFGDFGWYGQWPFPSPPEQPIDAGALLVEPFQAPALSPIDWFGEWVQPTIPFDPTAWAEGVHVDPLLIPLPSVGGQKRVWEPKPQALYATRSMHVALPFSHTTRFRDTSRSDRHPVFSGVALAQTEIGLAARFDEVDDRLVFSGLGGYGPEFSLSLLFRVSEVDGSAFQYLVSHGPLGTAESLNVYLTEAASPILRTHFRDADDPSDFQALDVPATSLVDGRWHSYMLRVSKRYGTSVWIDGGLRAMDFARGGDAFSPSGALYLGCREDLNADRFYGGDIGAFWIVREALPASAILRFWSDPWHWLEPPVLPYADEVTPIDTNIKRSMGMASGRTVLPEPADGGITAADRAHICYVYRGYVIGTPPVAPPITPEQLGLDSLRF